MSRPEHPRPARPRINDGIPMTAPGTPDNFDPLAETKADMPALTPDDPPAAAPARPPPPLLRFDAGGLPPRPPLNPAAPIPRPIPRELDLELSETTEERSRRTKAKIDVELDTVFDRPDSGMETASLSRFDPEAGRTAVAVKIRAVTEAVVNSVATPFGKLIVAILFGLVGLALAIAAVTLKDTPYIVAACIVTPIALLLIYRQYQIWLGHKRYMYRLLETLGEDVSEFDPHKMYRRVKAGRKKRR